MFVDLRIYFKGMALALFGRRPTLRRWFWIGFLNLLYWPMWWGVLIGRGLDHIFYRRFRRQPVRTPIFVVANPRSGTTFLHRLMCLDEERFTYMRLYETLLPSIAQQRFVELLGKVDRRLGGLLLSLRGWLERRMFGGWTGIHNMGFTRAEEDEGLFVYTMHTMGIYMLFPDIDQLGEASFTDYLSPRRRQRLMRYYRSCLQRHLYANGPERTLLSKNVLFCGRIQSVLETFPDARIIYLVRDPAKAVPSLVSMFSKPWRTHSPDIPKASPESRAFGQLAVDYYLHMHANRELLEDCSITVRYTDLIDDPCGTVERVYEYLGLEVSPEFRRRLTEETQKSREYQSAHTYSLEEYGLDREFLEDKLGDIIEYYDFRGSEEPDRPLDTCTPDAPRPATSQ